MHPVSGNKVFTKNQGGLRAPIKIEDGDDSNVYSPPVPPIQQIPQSDFMLDQGDQTSLQKHGSLIFTLGLVLIVTLIWFVLSCKANGKRGRRDDSESSGRKYRNRDPEANYK